MNLSSTVQWFVLLTSLAATRTTACSCFVWPTLDTMVQDEAAYIFRGIVIPRFLSSFSFSSLFSFLTNDGDVGRTREYTVRIQKVYKNGCVTDSSSRKLSSFTLSERQIVTIVSPWNSCGISALPLFRSFLLSGVITTSDESRECTLQQEQEASATIGISSSAGTTKPVIRAPTLRRLASSDVIVTMNADLCGSFVKLWRTVTRTERNTLSNEAVNNGTNTTQFECGSGN